MKVEKSLAFGVGLCIMAWFGVIAQVLLHFGISPIYAFIAGVTVSAITIIILFRKWRKK